MSSLAGSTNEPETAAAASTSVDEPVIDAPAAVPPTVRAAGPTGAAGADSSKVIERETPAGSCNGHCGAAPERGHVSAPPSAAGSLAVGSVVATPLTLVELRTSEKPEGRVAVSVVRSTGAPVVFVKVTVTVPSPPASKVAGETDTLVVTLETTTLGATVRHCENSDVAPLYVTVVVMGLDVGALKSELSKPTPVVVSAFSVCEPR